MISILLFFFCYRAEKEKSKFQAEVYELLAQVESVTKEKIISIKQVEKCEITINELSIKIEELNRTIVDITSHKTRLSQENVELIKDVQDLKLNLESVTYSRQQVATQLEDARRRLEDDERRRATLEASLHQVEIELESVRVQLEEEAEARLDLERQLVRANGGCKFRSTLSCCRFTCFPKWLIYFFLFFLFSWNFTAEAQQWHAKADAEAAARAEEVEELRRKYTVRIQEQEEHIEQLLVKVNNLEKQKSRLQSEIEVLIIDLERANGTARELQKRVDTLERTNIEIKARLEETLQLYDTAQRELRNKQAEIIRINNELDKTKDQRDTLARENKKLGGMYAFSHDFCCCCKLNWKSI